MSFRKDRTPGCIRARVGLVDHVVGCLQCIAALEGSFSKGKGSFGKRKVLAVVAVQGVSYWNVVGR